MSALQHQLTSFGHALRHHGGSSRKVAFESDSTKPPVLSRPQSGDPKALGVKSAKNQVKNLQKELVDRYHHLEDAITSQNGIGVLITWI